MIFTRRYRYRFGDIDDAGIAYYPAIFHYLHCCMEDWWSDGLGTPYHRVMREEHLGLPAVRIDAEFLRPIRYGDEPDISLGVLTIGRASVELGFWMARPAVEPGGSGELVEPGGSDRASAAAEVLCRARITTVAVDLRTMQSRPLPDRWRVELARFSISEQDFQAAR